VHGEQADRVRVVRASPAGHHDRVGGAGQRSAPAQRNRLVVRGHQQGARLVGAQGRDDTPHVRQVEPAVQAGRRRPHVDLVDRRGPGGVAVQRVPQSRGDRERPLVEWALADHAQRAGADGGALGEQAAQAGAVEPVDADRVRGQPDARGRLAAGVHAAERAGQRLVLLGQAGEQQQVPLHPAESQPCGQLQERAAGQAGRQAGV
jgi:hypothetical protein